MRNSSCNAWQTYYKKLTIEAAALSKDSQPCNNLQINYGDEMYVSPVAYLLPDGQNKVQQMSWQVTQFGKEFNVFSIIESDSRVTKHFAASFLSLGAAKKFALEMLLVCTKKLGRHGLTESN